MSSINQDRKLTANEHDWRVIALCRMSAATVAAELFRVIWPVTTRHQTTVTRIYGDVVLAYMFNYISSAVWRVRRVTDVIWLSIWLTVIYCSMESFHAYWREFTMSSLLTHALQTYTLISVVLWTMFAVDLCISYFERKVTEPESSSSVVSHAHHLRHAYFDEHQMPHRKSLVLDENELEPLPLDTTEAYSDIEEAEQERASILSFFKGIFRRKTTSDWAVEDDDHSITKLLYEENSALLYGGLDEWQATPAGWEDIVMREQNDTAISQYQPYNAHDPYETIGADLLRNPDIVTHQTTSASGNSSISDGYGPDAADIARKLRTQVGVFALVEPEPLSGFESDALVTPFEDLPDELVDDNEHMGRTIWQDNLNDGTISMADARPSGIAKYIRRLSHA